MDNPPSGDGAVRLRTRARIGAHVIWDHQVQPPALDPDDVPWRADAITPQWLTAALCGDVPGAEVESVEVVGGDDGSSIRRRLVVTYNEIGRQADLPTHLFTKATPTLLTRLTSGLAAAAEAGFYTECRGDLDIEAPIMRHSAVDSESLRSIHIFDDLIETRQATFCGHPTTISEDQASQIVDTLADVHSLLYDSPRFGRDLEWLPPFRQFVETNERNGFREGHDQAMIEAADVIPDDVIARKDEIWPKLKASLRWHDAEPHVLLHSDVHLGNWYVTGEGRMGLGDWATMCHGHWARDLAYAVTTSLATDDRRAWERGLVERYVDRMSANTPLRMSVDDAFQRYRSQTFVALFMWTPTLCHPPTMPDMQPPEMSRLMIQRITAAISDLESLDCEIP